MHVLPDLSSPLSLLSCVTLELLETDLLSHSDLNRLVMDYLVIEGYKAAAEEFGAEASVEAPIDLQSIESRMNIRDAVQRGDMEEAIMRVNDLNPEVSLSSTLTAGWNESKD